MPGKSRFSSEEQSSNITTFKQDSFAGGLNTDRPASELSEGELAIADNVKCFPKDVMGRPGTALFQNRRIAGTGDLHGIKYHQSTKKWITHVGDKIYRNNATQSVFWEELKLIDGTSFGIDSDSQFTENRENFIISTTSGIFHINIADDSTPNVVFQANSSAPNMPLGGSVSETEDHIYRVVYTYVRLTGAVTDGRITPGAVLEQETGSVNIVNAEDRDYSIYHVDEPIGPSEPFTITLHQTFTVDTSTDRLTLTGSYRTGDAFKVTTTGTLPSPLVAGTVYYAINTSGMRSQMYMATTKDNAFNNVKIDITTTGSGVHTVRNDYFNNLESHHTHIGIYMTSDLGSGIVDPNTNTGFNPEVYTWIKDVAVTPSGSEYDPATITIDIEADTWIARTATGGFNLKTRQWAPLPSGDLGEVAGGWFFSATSGEPTVNYSQINDSGNKGVSIGYYNPALQVNKLQDGVRAFVDIGDYVIACTSNKTYLYRINSFENVGVLESVFQLTVPAKIDDTIGIIDIGAIAHISAGRFIAVCSDASVRIFDTISWGPDLSLDKVKTSEIKKMQNGSIAIYWQGAYFLWYRKDSTDTHNTNTLRLAVEDAAGEGWTTYSGDDWIKPPLNAGTVNFVDSNDIQRAVVVDFTSFRPYWIETFDAYSGSGLVATYLDKSDDPGLCPLGSTFIYDALDNNSFDTSILVQDTKGIAIAVETDSLAVIDCKADSVNEMRTITVDAIGAGDDFDISVDVTDYHIPADSGLVLTAEVKLAPFLLAGDDLEVESLQGDGVWFSVSVLLPLSYALDWKIKQGATTYSSTQSVGSLSESIRITLVGNVITWYYGGVQIDTDTNAAWGSMPVLKGSFTSASWVTGVSDSCKFNNFSFIADSGLPGTCIGSDGGGSSGVPSRSPSATIKTKEIIGNRESNTKVVQEAHIYLRPAEEVNGFPSFFEVNAKDYVDGSVTANETVNDVRFLGDIQFFKEASGRRLQAEFITNSTDFRITSLDVDYIEKREKAQPLTTTTASGVEYEDTEVKTDQEVFHDDYNFFQSALGISWKFQITRYDYTLDIAKGARADGFKAIKAEQLVNLSSEFEEEGFFKFTGPDNKVGSALGWSVDGLSPTELIFSSSKLDFERIDSFVFNFWVKSPLIGASGRTLEITAGTNKRFYVNFPTSTSLDFGDEGTVTIDSVSDSLWHNFWIIRSGVNISVYQNTVLKGIITTGLFDRFGGNNFTIEFDDFDTYFFDIALKTTTATNVQVIALNTLTDYYNDVLNNEGNNYLP